MVLIPSHLDDALRLHRQDSDHITSQLRQFKIAGNVVRFASSRRGSGAGTAEPDEESCHLPSPEVYVPEELEKGCVFTGHTNTDMDSIACAVACAELYTGGIAARSSAINAETRHCLERWKIQEPPYFSDAVALLGTAAGEERVCLVDHNQAAQSPPELRPETVVGIIDHHALQSGTVCTDKAVFIDVRPWGSCCTIVAHQFLTMRRALSPSVAGMLLSGIISDTLNLQSPTTTSHDRLMVAVLAELSGVSDVNKLATEQFRAKSSSLAKMSAHQLVCGDRKKFDCTGSAIGFGTCEAFGGLGALLERVPQFVDELRALKKEESLDFNFLTLVDVENLRTVLVLPGDAERLLAVEAYGEAYGETYTATTPVEGSDDPVHGVACTLDLGGYISRKKNFIPPLAAKLLAGWTPPEEAMRSDDRQYGPVVMSCGADGCRLTRMSLRSVAQAVLMGRSLSGGSSGRGGGCIPVPTSGREAMGPVPFPAFLCFSCV